MITLEQNSKIETFEVSFMNHLWVEKNSFLVFILITFLAIYLDLSLKMFLIGLAGGFIFAGIALMNFVGIALHIHYFFQFERNRKVELYTNRIEISKNGIIEEQILKIDIAKITLSDKILLDGNAWPFLFDNYYYLTVIGKNQEKIILTCLLDIKLKKKVAAWYGKELEHKYQFFPFPK